VGRRWNNQPPEKQQEFTREFSKLLFNTYIGDIENYAIETDLNKLA
jgi:ABC-type transporter MlaC component